MKRATKRAIALLKSDKMSDHSCEKSKKERSLFSKRAIAQPLSFVVFETE